MASLAGAAGEAVWGRQAHLLLLAGGHGLLPAALGLVGSRRCQINGGQQQEGQNAAGHVVKRPSGGWARPGRCDQSPGIAQDAPGEAANSNIAREKAVAFLALGLLMSRRAQRGRSNSARVSKLLALLGGEDVADLEAHMGRLAGACRQESLQGARWRWRRHARAAAERCTAQRQHAPAIRLAACAQPVSCRVCRELTEFLPQVHTIQQHIKGRQHQLQHQL